MSETQLAWLIGVGVAAMAGALMVATLIIRKEFIRWSDAIGRIPGKEWFDEVAGALKGLAGQAAQIAGHTQELVDIEGRVRVVESDVRRDHDTLTKLQTQHDTIRGACLTGRGTA